jgi:hypothetical protein
MNSILTSIVRRKGIIFCKAGAKKCGGMQNGRFRVGGDTGVMYSIWQDSTESLELIPFER